MLNIEHHGNTQQLLNTFISAGFVPTITKATRISHGSSTLIDNLYVKYNQDNTDNLISGIISTDISDHLPIFVFFGKLTRLNKAPTIVKYRPFSDINISEMAHYLECIDWSQLNDMNIDDANTFLVTTIRNYLDIFVPEKIIRIPYKNILRQPWMTPALLTSSKNKDNYTKNVLASRKTANKLLTLLDIEIMTTN